MRLLALATLALSAADHWTTYVCLRRPVEGWVVSEANPISDWLFRSVGLGPGLLLDSVMTVIAVAFLLATPRLTPTVKASFLSAVVLATGYAVLNNVRAISLLGLSPFGL